LQLVQPTADPNAPRAPKLAARASAAEAAPAPVELAFAELPVVSQTVAGCGCSRTTCNFQPSVDNIRGLSDLLAGGTKKSATLTNMAWSFGVSLVQEAVCTVAYCVCMMLMQIL
jgi:hypothetical protein